MVMKNIYYITFPFIFIRKDYLFILKNEGEHMQNESRKNEFVSNLFFKNKKQKKTCKSERWLEYAKNLKDKEKEHKKYFNEFFFFIIFNFMLYYLLALNIILYKIIKVYLI